LNQGGAFKRKPKWGGNRTPYIGKDPICQKKGGEEFAGKRINTIGIESLAWRWSIPIKDQKGRSESLDGRIVKKGKEGSLTNRDKTLIGFGLTSPPRNLW